MIKKNFFFGKMRSCNISINNNIRFIANFEINETVKVFKKLFQNYNYFMNFGEVIFDFFFLFNFYFFCQKSLKFKSQN